MGNNTRGQLFNSHHALSAKMFSDNLQALASLDARGNDELADCHRINRENVHTALKPLLPALLLGKKVAKLLRHVLKLIAKPTQPQ